MTDRHTTALTRVADVSRAIDSFPHTVPDLDSVIIGRTYVRLQVYRNYGNNEWPEYRRLAQLAAAFSASIHIEKERHGTRKQIRVEFDRLGIGFKCLFDITTPAARELAKALGRKLTAETLTVTTREFLQAVDALEQS